MRQIKNFMQEAEIIVSKLDGLADAHRTSAQASRRFNELLENVRSIAGDQLVVADRVRDATGLYKRGSWVLIDPTPPTSREDTRSRRPRRITHSEERRPRRRTLSQERGIGYPQPPIPPHGSIIINTPTVGQGKGKERRTDRGPPEASSSRSLQNHVESNRLDSQNAGDIVGSENDRSTQPPDTRSPQGAVLKYFSAPGASDEYEEINGYISKRMGRNSKSSSRTITARLYPNFFVNAMSRVFAEQLGLTVTVLSDEYFVETLSVVGSTQAGVNRTVGEVRFVWHTPTHILRVTCIVFEQEMVPGVPLALGKPYVQQIETAGGVVRGESSRAGAAS